MVFNTSLLRTALSRRISTSFPQTITQQSSTSASSIICKSSKSLLPFIRSAPSSIAFRSFSASPSHLNKADQNANPNNNHQSQGSMDLFARALEQERKRRQEETMKARGGAPAAEQQQQQQPEGAGGQQQQDPDFEEDLTPEEAERRRRWKEAQEKKENKKVKENTRNGLLLALAVAVMVYGYLGKCHG
jgi:hypothetical protein